MFKSFGICCIENDIEAIRRCTQWIKWSVGDKVVVTARTETEAETETEYQTSLQITTNCKIQIPQQPDQSKQLMMLN